jgi:hypothetical protein
MPKRAGACLHSHRASLLFFLLCLLHRGRRRDTCQVYRRGTSLHHAGLKEVGGGGPLLIDLIRAPSTDPPCLLYLQVRYAPRFHRHTHLLPLNPVKRVFVVTGMHTCSIALNAGGFFPNGHANH